MIETLKLIHVLAAIIWVGGSIMAQLFALRLTAAAPAHRLGFARDLRFAASRIFVPSAIVLLGAGIWMVADSPGFAFGDPFVVIGLVAVGGSLATAIGYLIPNIGRAIELMTSGRGPEAGAVIRKVALAARAVIVILLVAVWAMVVKPGG
jgi:uncharacterized membrane protein